MKTGLDNLNLFGNSDKGSARLWDMLRDPKVTQLVINRHDVVFYSDNLGVHQVDKLFPNQESYIDWLNSVMSITDVGYKDINDAKCSVIEGSFNPQLTDLHGSIHISTKEITRGDPALTIRKQPRQIVSLDEMLKQGMMSNEMRLFLELAVRGRSNILLSGGSGAGKTTLARALSWFIDPLQRVITVEEIDELHLANRLPNVVSLTTYRHSDEEGRVVRETSLGDLVREALRMRADRIWVGETRGSEAYALVKACNSGHDGSITTVHGDTGQQAVKQLITYVMEGGLTEEVARDQVAQAFHLVIQISRVKMGKRVITEITELESVREGTEQRRNPLFLYNHETEEFTAAGRPTNRLIQHWTKYGVNYENIAQRKSLR